WGTTAITLKIFACGNAVHMIKGTPHTYRRHRTLFSLAFLGQRLTQTLGVFFLAIIVQLPSSTAALNENCTVSILNRTAQVKPDGTWVLPNIPANLGQVRARATCVENGITRSGQSELFLITANGSVTVPQIRLDKVEPIPSSLTLSAPK